MITITETATRIGCSRTTIYAALKRLDIKPHRQKRKFLLDDEQIALVQESLPGDSTHSTEPAGDDKRQEKVAKAATTPIEAKYTHHLLFEQLQAEATHLKTLLEREQAERTSERIERADERKAERERAERHDALVTALLSEQKGLRDEVQRLKAIRGPEQVFSAFDGNSPDEDEKPIAADTSAPRTTSEVVHLERSSERVERSAERTSERPVEQAAPTELAEATPQPEAVVGNNSWSNRLTAFGFISTAMILIALFLTISNPNLFLSKAIASLWQ
mgnify:FL=1